MLEKSLIKDIEKSIAGNWDFPAFTDFEGSTRTYGKLGKRILLWHEIFRELGLKKGDKISLAGRNSSNWAEIFLASLSYGSVAVPILPDFTPENIRHIISHSDSKVLFVSDNIFKELDIESTRQVETVFSLNDFCLLYTTEDKAGKQVERAKRAYQEKYQNLGAASFKLPEQSNGDTAAIVYTSGATGFSKGVMLSHNSLTANVAFAQEAMPLEPNDKILSFLPAAHSYACAFEFLFPVSIGCHITFLKKIPAPPLLLKAFSEVKPRLIFLVPLLIEKIFKSKIKPALEKPLMKAALKTPVISKIILGKIRKRLVTLFGGNFIEVIIGGAALNPEVERFLKKIRFPYAVGYGMTECGPLISYYGSAGTKLFSVGKPINYLRLRINSDDPYNKVGEILVKGENVMDGYYKNPEMTREAIDEDGWLHTGDLGVIDKDGFLYIKGRSKNMILGPSGQNIYPEEIEATLNTFPFVQESLVIESNGKLVALVFPDFEMADSEGIEVDGLNKKMNENLAAINGLLPSYSKLSAIRLYPEEFEKTPTKKIKRYLYDIP